MPLAEKGVRGKGRQPLSPPQHTVTPEREQRSGQRGNKVRRMWRTTCQTATIRAPSEHADAAQVTGFRIPSR